MAQENHTQSLKKAAKRLVKDGKFNAALDLIEEGLKNGFDEDLVKFKAEVLTNLGRFDEALQCYDKFSVRLYLLLALLTTILGLPGGFFLMNWVTHHGFAPGPWSNILELFLFVIALSLIVMGIGGFALFTYQGLHILLKRRNLQKRIRHD